MKIILLLACGWWLGCLLAFMFGGYFPSNFDIGLAMFLSALHFLYVFVDRHFASKESGKGGLSGS